jgi:hypothetical protein
MVFRVAVVTTTGVLLAVVVFAGVAGLVNQMTVATLAALASLAAAAMLARRRSAEIASALARAPAWARRLFVVGATLLLFQLLPIAAFIIHPTIDVWTAQPWRPWQSAHSCASAYWMAAQFVTQTANVYDDTMSSLPQVDKSRPRQPRRMGPVNIDAYEYPPTFLPVPRLMAAATTDFWQFRRLWFALNLAVVVIVLVMVARHVDAAFGTQTLWLTPWVLVSPAIVGTFQAGNAQFLFIAMAVAAMLLFARGRQAAGGALLAYAIVSKLFPAMLVLYLAFRRDWRALGWTALWGAVIVGVSLIDVGLTPFAAFAEHMPRLLSGEAFPAFRNPSAIAINESIPGIMFKLRLWGGPSLGFDAMRVVGWIYTVVLAAVTAWLALRPSPREAEPLAWIAILGLATMRSPFLPHYAGFPFLWLATLTAARYWHQPAVRWTTIALWIVLAINTGQNYAPPPLTAAWTLVHTLGAIVVVTVALRHLAEEATSPHPQAARAQSARG